VWQFTERSHGEGRVHGRAPRESVFVRPLGAAGKWKSKVSRRADVIPNEVLPYGTGILPVLGFFPLPSGRGWRSFASRVRGRDYEGTRQPRIANLAASNRRCTFDVPPPSPGLRPPSPQGERERFNPSIFGWMVPQGGHAVHG
jgi:hypothetical protein